MNNPRRTPKAARTINSYLRLRPEKGIVRKEFWTNDRIAYLRELALTGKAVIRTLEDAEQYGAGSRSLRDRISLTAIGPAVASADTSVEIGGGHKKISLSVPLVWGDMSFGAIHAQAVRALVKSAEVTGILSGTGEGGLHPDIRQYTRYNVQWASARFGVDLETLKSGSAIFIKIGQGAKPGIGGHLPGKKVVGDIPMTRRIPEGKDAISPAPHHDIYSIEDLGQRIWALKVATGQPVFVKVAATNYVPYVACGIARMGADGVVIDGHLAGTGATPEVVRDNVGIPIELAVASSDRMLREQHMDGEPLRNRISIIAGGGVTSSTDMIKLLALGADACMMGTGALMAMGCVMVHRCHTGKCPTALATQTPHRLLDMDWATERCIQLVHGLQDEMQILLSELGASSVADVIGNRDLLRGRDLSAESLSILGIEPMTPKRRIVAMLSEPPSETDEEPTVWKSWRNAHIDVLAETAEALITSMGAQAAPFIEPPQSICDWLRSDGAQVTRPSTDPYREEIETSTYLADGAIRLSMPMFFDLSDYERLGPAGHEFLARCAAALGLVSIVPPDALTSKARRFGRAILLDVTDRLDLLDADTAATCAGLVLSETNHRTLADQIRSLRRSYGRPLFVRIAPRRNLQSHVLRIARAGAHAIIIQDQPHPDTGRVIQDLTSDEFYPLEVAVSLADTALRMNRNGSQPLRRSVGLMAEADRIRGAEDLFKLIALGADAVGVGTLALIGAFGRADADGDADFDYDSQTARIRLENLCWGMQKELKLLLGAAGTSSATTLVSSRELVRSVDLDPAIRQLLDVKPAGL